MVVRIRFGKAGKVVSKRHKNRRVAQAVAALLTPAALMAGALGLWRLAADLNLTSSFAISSGIFSHWQVWAGAAVGLQVCARILNHYAKGEDAAASSASRI